MKQSKHSKNTRLITREEFHLCTVLIRVCGWGGGGKGAREKKGERVRRRERRKERKGRQGEEEGGRERMNQNAIPGKWGRVD
jgi:hypothetical protein